MDKTKTTCNLPDETGTIDDPLRDETYAAEFLGLSKPTLKRYRANGIGPDWLRVGFRAVRYRQSALEKFPKPGKSQD